MELHEGASEDLDAIQQVFEELPPHSRPGRIEILDALPMTDGYRIMKAALLLQLAD